MTREEVQQAIIDGRMIHIFDKRFNYYRTIQPYMYIIEVFDENGFEMHTRDVYPYTTYYFKYEDCTLDEEKVKEHNEFGNITRTERLDLPSWEEFNKVSVFTFKRKNGTDMEIAIWDNCPDDNCKTIKITRSYDWSACCFEKPLTRENYNEARRLCVKLFKGEEV